MKDAATKNRKEMNTNMTYAVIQVLCECSLIIQHMLLLALTVLVATIDAQWEGMGDVGSARYEPALLPPCPTIRVLRYSN